MAGQVVRFGPFELNTAAGQLRREGQPVNLTGLPYRLLEFLAQRSGQITTREDIRAHLWPDDHNVDFEASINVAIRKVREALDESADAPVYLHTLRGRGYRFEGAEVVALVHDPVPEPIIAAAVEADPVVSVAATPVPTSPQRRWRWASTQAQTSWTMIAAGLALAGILAFGFAKLTPGGRAVALGERQITYSGSVTHLAVSPDGSQMAYVDLERGSAVLRLCPTGAQSCPVRVREVGSVYRLLFSANGKWLFFGSHEGLAPGRNIYRMSLSGSGPPTIVVRGRDRLQSVSSDGLQVLVLHNGEIEDSVHLTDVRDGSDRLVAARKRPDRLTAAALSPDGRKLAFWWQIQNRTDAYYSLMTVRLDDGTEEQLSSERWMVAYPAPEVYWLNEKRLAAILFDKESSTREVYEFSVPSGVATRISEGNASYSHLSAFGDPPAISAVRDPSAAQIWVTKDGNPETLRQLTSDAGGYRTVSWMSGGEILASGRGVWRIDIQSGARTAIPGMRRSDSQAVASPDGRSIFFQSFRESDMAIWKADMDGSGAHRMTRGDSGGTPKVTPDSRWLVYGGYAEDGIAVWRMPAAGGVPERVSKKEHAFEPDISPDGKWVAAASDQQVIRVFSIDGGEPLKSFPTPVYSNRPVWLPDGSGISYLGHKDRVSNLWMQPLAGGPPQMVTQFDTDQILSHAWSRDRRLALLRVKRQADGSVIGVR